MQKAVIFVVATYASQTFFAFVIQWLNIAKQQAPLPATVVTKCCNFTEIFVGVLTLLFISIWIKDLRKSSLMHANLKFVCYLISFHITTASILQIVTIIDRYNQFIPSSIKILIRFILGSARVHFILDPGAAVLERGIATLKVANYEKAASRKQWCTLMFIKEIIGMFLSYTLTYVTLGPVIFGICWIFWLIVTVIIAITLYRVNLRSYKTRIGTLHLTTRYQTVENIRCLKPVLIYSFLAVIQNVIAFILLLFLFIHLMSGDYNTGSNLESMINLLIAIFCAFYPVAFLAYSSRIRVQMKKQFNRIGRDSTVSPMSTPVLSVMGKVLTSKNEQNIYFTQLDTAWK